jgi:cytochrome c oxidase subunit 3
MNAHAQVDTHGHAAHAHHWEWSWAPAAISVGILCLSLTIPMYFVYEAKLAAIIFAGVSVPLILAGIANWMGSQGVTGPTDLKLNSLTLTLFIFSEGLIFLAMFIAYYFLRISAGQEEQPWPPAGTPEINQQLAVISTAILILSAVIYSFAEKQFESSKGGFTILLLLTIVLGSAFIASTVYEYSHLLAEGFKPGTNAYSTPFYTLTGFHAAHILVGIAAFLVILFGAIFGKVHSSLVRLAGVYWYFVTFLSFFVVTQVYFW